MLISFRRPVAAALIALGAVPAASTAAQPPAIRDNSFLVEEAYNQEAGVVQHAGLLLRASRGDGWQFTFAQEWPLWSQRHQFSLSVPVVGGTETTGLGDVGLHYRYQLLGGGEERLALAPRLSLFIPTGDPEHGAGVGSVGVQAGLPASLALGSRFDGHLNLGATLTPSAENPGGSAATAFDLAAGASLVWHAAPWVNLLAEAVWERAEEVVAPGAVAAREEAFLAPGVRFAWNLPGGKQVVPGIAYAFGVGPSAGGDSFVLVYLSFEHSFRRRLTGAVSAAQLALHPSRQAR